MLATSDSSLEDLRNSSLRSLGYTNGGRRLTKIAVECMRDLRWIGDRGYIYQREQSKTQQAGIRAP